MKLKWGILAALISGALLAISRDTGQYGWLVLIAPVPLLVYALKAPRPLPVFLLAFLAGVAGEAGPMQYYGRILPPIYAMAVLQGVVFGVSVLFLRALYRRYPAAVAVLGYAAMTAGWEYLYGLVSPNGSFGALGYALVDVPPLLQVASLGGVALLSFLAAIIPAGLAVLGLKRDGLTLAIWGVPVAAALVFGLWQLAQPLGPKVSVALLGDDRHAGKVFDHPEHSVSAEADFKAQIAALPGKPAVIVLPEKMFAPDANFSAAARSAGAAIVSGLEDRDDHHRLNAARLDHPPAAVETYYKKRMVPGLEAEYLPGTRLLITELHGVKTGVVICKDMDFPADLRAYGRQDIGLLLVPAWDFDGDRYLHGRMAVVRGVENGFAIARSASQGLLTLSDSHGRIIAETRTAAKPITLIGDLPSGRGGTLYSRIADIFAQAVTAAWLGLLILLLWPRRR